MSARIGEQGEGGRFLEELARGSGHPQHLHQLHGASACDVADNQRLCKAAGYQAPEVQRQVLCCEVSHHDLPYEQSPPQPSPIPSSSAGDPLRAWEARQGPTPTLYSSICQRLASHITLVSYIALW